MKVGITHGDFNGANYEILLKVFDDPHITELFTPVIYGSPRVAAWYRKTLGLPEFHFNIIDDASKAKDNAVNIVNIMGADEPDITPGKSTPVAGEASRKALEAATADLKEGKIDVLVTAPVNKENIQGDGFNFPGHTEYLEAVLGEGSQSKALMVMSSENLKVALVTTHKPLRDVADAITQEIILAKLRLFNETLEIDFTRPHPRIAVLSLNPHAGDSGVLGHEEVDVIAPAIEKAKEEGIMAFGPFGADGFFGSGNYRHFDGVLAMYHDQGLIPFKLMAMETGVNYTAGLPFVRTSPDHGTAYDIAGKGVADPAPLRQAIYAAMDIKRNRERNSVLKQNPLKKLYNTSGRSENNNIG